VLCLANLSTILVVGLQQRQPAINTHPTLNTYGVGGKTQGNVIDKVGVEAQRSAGGIDYLANTNVFGH